MTTTQVAEKKSISSGSSTTDHIQKTDSSSESLSNHKGQQRARGTLNVDLDLGDVQVKTRNRWWQLWIPSTPPPKPPLSLADAPDIPLTNASIFSVLTFAWVQPLMTLGYQRTLQATDLWKLDHGHSASVLSAKFDSSWEKRNLAANEWNKRLDRGDIHPSFLQRTVWVFKSLRSLNKYSDEQVRLEKEWRTSGGKKKPSISLALNDAIGFFFWSGGMFKVFGDTSQLMGPLILKAIINFAKRREHAKETGEPTPNIGIGIAMAVGLFCLTICSSIGQHQFFWRSMVTGNLARTALIKSIYKRGVNLTGKARSQLSNSDLMNHISTDVSLSNFIEHILLISPQVSRIDACAQWFHAAWTAPIQIIVCLIILIFQLGPSALAGFALFVAVAPIQERMMAKQFQVRKKSMKYTDQRAKTLLEVLGAMRVVKYFSYEVPFLTRIHELRKRELKGVEEILIFQSANVALAFSIPVLAATLAFVTYTHVVKGFDAAVIFASLSLFQLLRQPMMFLPRALSATSDARNAISRLHKVFNAELRSNDAIHINPSLPSAVAVTQATFEWEEAVSQGETAAMSLEDQRPFRLSNITMDVPRGSLIAIVGRVGSGKSSLLSGLIGDMRRVAGEVQFGGRVAFCAQTAWIQNASVRDNIIFGQPYEEEKYWEVIKQASLIPDLELLADGDLTEIGEKGVNLSGGQKQRINIARALYFDANVVILDDPLSAVDAHVGKSLFQDAILGALRKRGKTVIFVTHALHFLSQCDYIYTMDSGCIAEQGTYAELMASNGEFARLSNEYGGGATDEEDRKVKPNAESDIHLELLNKAIGTGKLEGKLMVKERRATGSISNTVYKAYVKAGKGLITLPLLLVAMVMMQGSQILSSYTLVWWQANFFNRPFSFYQILYASLGIAQSISTFLMGFSADVFSYFVSRNLHRSAIFHIFHAPMSFFDTTPMGRIIGVFGKDIDNMDNQLPVSLRMLLLTMSNVLGSVIIITVIEHYFIVVAFFVALGYQYFAAYYRASAREVKRLDAMLRSLLYSHMSESLTGLPTLRTYGEIPRFIKDNEYYIDLENRALFLTCTNQRWLSVRLDFCGALLVFFVALFAVVGVSGATAAQIGLVLTYTTSLTQACGMLTRQTAEVENYLNSVERVAHYSQQDLMEQEAPHEIPKNKPRPTWPEHGEIRIKDLAMRYRPDLPNVLHGISLSVRGGEKIGIVGRTGAGKSSITLALLRIVEYSGLITLDGVDIAQLGLKDLRTKVAIIPQDPTVFSGTVRSALDPFSLYDDTKLWDALRRSYLVGYSSNSEDAHKITLDTIIESEGSNLSVGERSLLSLARALVRDTRVVILDEATASVDLETDQKIQQTIQTEFKDRTLICIAHRLRTILSYDRILVLESGNVAEFDTPLALFRKESGLFRGLCENSNISEEDILTSKQ
ncbi:ABC protein [Panaeolus papilionaceus]|nr:ABC protein [Panaeolus papilionaceus]